MNVEDMCIFEIINITYVPDYNRQQQYYNNNNNKESCTKCIIIVHKIACHEPTATSCNKQVTNTSKIHKC